MLKALIQNLVVFSLTLACAQAGAILTDYPANPGASGVALVGSVTRSYGVGFTMPSGGAYSLDSVTMNLSIGSAGRNFTLELYGGTSANPSGPALATFFVPAFVSTGTSDYTFTPGAPVTLASSGTYWLVAYALTSGNLNQVVWNQSLTNPAGVATYVGDRYDSPAVAPPTGLLGVTPIFQINATPSAVPEPSSAILLGAGLVGLYYGGKRWNRRSA